MSGAGREGRAGRLERAGRDAARLSGWLALVLVATKASYLGLPEETSLAGLRRYADRLASIAHEDVLFAAGFGLLAAAALAAAGGRPRARRAASGALLATGAACAAYAVVHLRIFAYFRTPLTLPLLSLAPSLASLRSSVGAFLGAPLGAAIVLAPAAYALAVLRARRPSWAPARLGWAAAAALAPAAVAFVVLGARGFEERWYKREDWRIAQSPHGAILASIAAEIGGGARVVVRAGEHRPEDLPELAPRAERAPAGPSAFRGPRPRNVVLFVFESVSAKYVTLYGSPYDTTPNLVREAAHALVLDAAYCHAGRSSSSLAAILHSIYPPIAYRDVTLEYPALPGTTVAGLLRARGFRTAFFGSGDYGFADMDDFLAGRGFDEVRHGDQLGGERLSSWGVEDRRVADAVIRFIDADPGRERPFFVVAWTNQTHHPYDAAPGAEEIDFFAGRPLPRDDYDLRRFLNALREGDRQLGRIFAALRERGLADDTLVVVTSDHGEAFGDPHETWGHGGGLYQQDVHVPLVLWNPRAFGGAGRSDAIASHVDLAPTIADIAGVPAPGEWRGRSLFEPERPPRAYFYALRYDWLIGVREGRWKYVFNVLTGVESLFDLSRDPEERKSLAALEPDRCRRLRQRLAAWIVSLERCYAPGSGSAP